MLNELTEKERIKKIREKSNILTHPAHYEAAIIEFEKYKAITPTAGKRLMKARRWLEEEQAIERGNRNHENMEKISKKIRQIDELLKRVKPCE